MQLCSCKMMYSGCLGHPHHQCVLCPFFRHASPAGSLSCHVNAPLVHIIVCSHPKHIQVANPVHADECAFVSVPLIPRPGIIRSTETQEDVRYVSLIRELTIEYISKERSIIVLAVTANNDLENQVRPGHQIAAGRLGGVGQGCRCWSGVGGESTQEILRTTM